MYENEPSFCVKVSGVILYTWNITGWQIIFIYYNPYIYIAWMVQIIPVIYRKLHQVFFGSKQVSITKRPHQVQSPNLKNAVPVMSRTWTKGSPEKIPVKLKTGWNLEKRWALRKPGNFVTAATYQKQNKHPKLWVGVYKLWVENICGLLRVLGSKARNVCWFPFKMSLCLEYVFQKRCE